MSIAAEMCIYTNNNFVVEKIPDDANKLTASSASNVLSVDYPAEETKDEKKEGGGAA